MDYCDYFYYHNGQQTDPGNEEFRQFDEFLKELNGCVANAPTPFPLECQLPHRIISKAINWIDTVPADVPFFAYVAFPEPHNPYQVPEPYYSMFPEDKVPPIATSAADL